MTKKTIKIENLSRSDTTLNFKNLNEKVYPVKAGGFAMLDDDELTYLMNTSKVFERGTLKIVNTDEAAKVVDITELQSSNALSGKDIDTLLNKQHKHLSAEIEKIDNQDVLQRILTRAKEADKSVKIVELVETRLKQLLEQ